jgi:hypothetical protein
MRTNILSSGIGGHTATVEELRETLTCLGVTREIAPPKPHLFPEEHVYRPPVADEPDWDRAFIPEGWAEWGVSR